MNFQVGQTVQAHPKTNKAKQRVNQGLGKSVVIVDYVEKCQAFKNEPAYMIAPKGQPTKDSIHSRWVKVQGDQDFRLAEF